MDQLNTFYVKTDLIQSFVIDHVPVYRLYDRREDFGNGHDHPPVPVVEYFSGMDTVYP